MIIYRGRVTDRTIPSCFPIHVRYVCRRIWFHITILISSLAFLHRNSDCSTIAQRIIGLLFKCSPFFFIHPPLPNVVCTIPHIFFSTCSLYSLTWLPRFRPSLVELSGFGIFISANMSSLVSSMVQIYLPIRLTTPLDDYILSAPQNALVNRNLMLLT